ncbi:hypothetical protein DY000_02020850 [Brassica cretica]|uniref:Uncharacterized protein n=1 Tax=Brassica cretica TaxID=69181 RepID=A0ABQ7EGZ4_BRACR|nr:hypothetical protein DY000_02020850 [Brassica cretica]
MKRRKKMQTRSPRNDQPATKPLGRSPHSDRSATSRSLRSDRQSLSVSRYVATDLQRVGRYVATDPQRSLRSDRPSLSVSRYVVTDPSRTQSLRSDLTVADIDQRDYDVILLGDGASDAPQIVDPSQDDATKVEPKTNLEMEGLNIMELDTHEHFERAGRSDTCFGELGELSELSDTTLELDELSDTNLELNELNDTEDGAGLDQLHQMLDEIKVSQQTRSRPTARRERPRRTNQSEEEIGEEEFHEDVNKSQKKSTTTCAPVAEQPIFISEKPNDLMESLMICEDKCELPSPESDFMLDNEKTNAETNLFATGASE